MFGLKKKELIFFRLVQVSHLALSQQCYEKTPEKAMFLLVAVDIMRLLIYCVGEMSLRISLANMSTLFLGVHSFIFRIFF